MLDFDSKDNIKKMIAEGLAGGFYSVMCLVGLSV